MTSIALLVLIWLASWAIALPARWVQRRKVSRNPVAPRWVQDEPYALDLDDEEDF